MIYKKLKTGCFILCVILNGACSNHVEPQRSSKKPSEGADTGHAQQVPQTTDPHPVETPDLPKGVPTSQATVGSDWVLNFVDSTAPHGLRVFGNGAFRIGPTAGGQVVVGNLDPVELKALKELLAREWRGPASGELSVRSDTRGLHSEMTGLAVKYVPDKFPHPCFDAVADLREFQKPLRRCKMASDCAYVDELLQPVDIGANTSLVLDDCTYMDALPVANAFETIASQRDLILARELAAEICGSHVNRKSCGRPVKIRTNLTYPVCVNGECRLSPELTKGES